MIGLLVLGLTAWLFCGLVNAGFYYAYMQREYPVSAAQERPTDTRSAWATVVFGLAGLVATGLTGFYMHGWLWPGRKP